ncbi:hypothetical protein A2U01_0060343, partial [Trifolium medium]|nr:hypothetical protein [Trifolium medium]
AVTVAVTAIAVIAVAAMRLYSQFCGFSS